MRLTATPAVWLADVDALHERLEAAEACAHLLSAEERAWSSGPPDVRRRRRGARIALRLLLLRAGVPAARGVAFETEAAGKPRLPEGSGGAWMPLSFNVSHSAGQALIAVAAGPDPVGVDIEAQRTVQLDASRQALIAAAGDAIAAGSAQPVPSARAPDVLVAWTRLEAFAKARGTGMGRLLTELGIVAAAGRSITAADAGAAAARLRKDAAIGVMSLTLPEGLHGALAARTLPAPHVVRVLADEDCRPGA